MARTRARSPPPSEKRSDEEEEEEIRRTKRGRKTTWSPEEELLLLNNLLHFQSAKGPLKLTPASLQVEGGFFQHLVMGPKETQLLSILFTPLQISDKLRKLRTKYLAKKSREPNSSHARAVFELCKQIWGGGGRAVVPAGGGGGGGGGTVGSLNLKDHFCFLKEAVESMELSYAEQGFEMMDPETAAALNERIRIQKKAEVEHIAARLILLKETFMNLISPGIDAALPSSRTSLTQANKEGVGGGL